LGSFLRIYDFLYEILIFSMKIFIFCMKISDFLYLKKFMIFSMIFLTFHNKVRVSTGSVETRWLGGIF